MLSDVVCSLFFAAGSFYSPPPPTPPRPPSANRILVAGRETRSADSDGSAADAVHRRRWRLHVPPKPMPPSDRGRSTGSVVQVSVPSLLPPVYRRSCAGVFVCACRTVNFFIYIYAPKGISDKEKRRDRKIIRNGLATSSGQIRDYRRTLPRGVTFSPKPEIMGRGWGKLETIEECFI